MTVFSVIIAAGVVITLMVVVCSVIGTVVVLGVVVMRLVVTSVVVGLPVSEMSKIKY